MITHFSRFYNNPTKETAAGKEFFGVCGRRKFPKTVANAKKIWYNRRSKANGATVGAIKIERR